MAKKAIELGYGKCNACPRHKKSPVICIGGFGPKNPTLVCIAESPARVEVTWCQQCQRPQLASCRSDGHRIGQPLVGAAGQLLRRALTEAGFNPDEVYFTNVAHCGIGTPTLNETRICSNIYLLNELQELDYTNCRAVFLLGEIALRTVLNNGRLTLKDCRLKDLSLWGPRLSESGVETAGKSTENGPKKKENTTKNKAPRRPHTLTPPQGRRLIPEPVPLLATFHPAACLPQRNPRLYSELVDDLATAWKPREQPRPLIEATFRALRQMHPDMIGLDLEWTSQGKIRFIGLSDGEQNLVTKDPVLVLEWLRNRSAGDGLPEMSREGTEGRTQSPKNRT